MDYIFANWNELNTMDRFWFLTGAWLMGLFLTVSTGKIFRGLWRRWKNRHLHP